MWNQSKRGKWDYCWLPCCIMLLLASSNSYAKGLLPDRNNQITICTDSPVDRPYFTLIFTSQPLAQTISLNQGRITQEQLSQLGKAKESVVVVVGGKKPDKAPSCYDFFFGNERDGNQPWNNGVDFHWQSWTDHSDEVWDNLAIAAGVSGGDALPQVTITVNNVIVKRGGMLLFDSRKTRSIPNNNPIAVGIAPSRIGKDQDLFAVVDLGEAMKKFKRLYYELDNTLVLLTAYDDLGQTDNSKYLPVSRGWCSEFASHVYRASGFAAPDPKRGEITWRVIKDHFAKHGKIYGLHEVSRWTQQEREARIKPGSLVSIVTTSGTAHILLLTQWIQSDDNGAFTAISGNNHGMVWTHPSISLKKLLKDEDLKGMSRIELNRYHDRSFIAIPGMTPEN